MLLSKNIALCDGIADAIYIRAILSEILSIRVPITAVTDHDGLFKNIHSTKMVDDKRLRIDLASIKEDLFRKVVEDVERCSSGEMLADSLTKKGASGWSLLSVLQNGKFANH